ncbi:aldo/keto reductase [Lacticaseibacillus nasuensis]|uniref:Oxidoreductase n=1 Tax=Lacticaseibacillus nasuensis JCM 17158 TaxID=1291734 RepID=A0A0R1JNJ2_9LACO|nr:aldo/keto reductase [Lacticaseibacillus nasuensis]KRK72877.1 oxidoreductase [Lacticaseibacillus nasuensis JCM 17158]
MTSSILTDTYTLANGVTIPKVGFGTWQIPQSQAEEAVYNALTLGYRHIDTALAYQNEQGVGAGIKDAGIPREQIFVTTKLPAETKTYAGAKQDFETSLKNLGLDYVDLYLIHAPWPWAKRGNYDQENKDVWRAMEEIYQSGRAKAIGISNFGVPEMKNIFAGATVKPMVNQIQYHVGYTENVITKFAKDNGLLVEAYSPLATGRLLQDPDLTAIAESYNVSIAQLAIKFCLQNGTLPLPKATHRDHAEINAQLDFTISDKDMAKLNSLEEE